GKAVAFAALGFPAGEAVVPLVAVAALALTDWRTVWAVASLAFPVVVLPVALWLLTAAQRRATIAPDAPPPSGARPAAAAPLDRRFALLLPAVAVPGLVITGI